MQNTCKRKRSQNMWGCIIIIEIQPHVNKSFQKY